MNQWWWWWLLLSWNLRTYWKQLWHSNLSHLNSKYMKVFEWHYCATCLNLDHEIVLTQGSVKPRLGLLSICQKVCKLINRLKGSDPPIRFKSCPNTFTSNAALSLNATTEDGDEIFLVLSKWRLHSLWISLEVKNIVKFVLLCPEPRARWFEGKQRCLYHRNPLFFPLPFLFHHYFIFPLSRTARAF